MPDLIDITVEVEGTRFLFTAQTEAGRRWIVKKVDPRVRRCGEAIAIEHRHIGKLVRGALRDGLVVR